MNLTASQGQCKPDREQLDEWASEPPTELIVGLAGNVSPLSLRQDIGFPHILE